MFLKRPQWALNLTEGVTWTRSAKLYANDMNVGNYFGENVAVSGDWVVTSAMNDFETGWRSGSAYMFKNTAGAWSQQQKLMAADLIYWQPERDFAKYEVILGVKVFANSVSIKDDTLALGVRRSDNSETLTDGVYIYTGDAEENRWSVQQRPLLTLPMSAPRRPCGVRKLRYSMVVTSSLPPMVR